MQSAEYAAVADAINDSTTIPHPRRLCDRSPGGHGADWLGIRKDDWARQTDEFSGGWQMRIALAKLLLRKAEPAAARRAHEPSGSGVSQLARGLSARTIPFAFVLISHDRYFLDVTVTQDRGDME